jgi:predicted O-methyltransferase YrrM
MSATETEALNTPNWPSDLPTDLPYLVRKCQMVADRNNFIWSSEPRTGALLRTLAASKPGGRFLEVGAGVGVGAAWLLSGMDAASRLTTLELRPQVAQSCRLLLEPDPRVEVITADCSEWLAQYDGPPFDFVFVDTTVTKFDRRDLLFGHMSDGAFLFADDLLPQPKWSAEHPPRVNRFRQDILDEPQLFTTLMNWASGVVIATYHRPAAEPDSGQ